MGNMTRRKPWGLGARYGIRCNCHHRLRRRFEQKAIDGLLVPVGDAGNLRRQREDDMEILPRAADPLPALPSSCVPLALGILDSAYYRRLSKREAFQKHVAISYDELRVVD